jgi:hypothetical protein
MRNTNKPLTGNELVYERDHMAVVQRDAFRDLGFAEEDRLSELDETIQNITQVLDEFFGSQYLNGRVTYDAIAEGDFGIVYGSGFTRIDFALGAGSRTLVEFIESLFSNALCAKHQRGTHTGQFEGFLCRRVSRRTIQ